MESGKKQIEENANVKSLGLSTKKIEEMLKYHHESSNTETEENDIF